MEQPPYLITGVAGTGVHPRLELRELEKDPIQYSLFIQAMNKVFNMNNTQDTHSTDYYNKPNSWWQMASIHGLPYTPWSGDPEGPQEPNGNSNWGGYCYHASALFPPWHRILLLLVEQSVVEEAIAIATKLEDENWIQAAKKLRFPFWDWTRAETAEEGIPELFQKAQVEIITVNGLSFVVDNPLNHYKFAKSPGEVKGVRHMGKWTRTYRWGYPLEQPTEELYADAQKAFAEGATIILGGKSRKLQPHDWLRDKVAALFTYDLMVKDPGYGGNMWGYFSNTGAKTAKIDPVMDPMPPSIEEPHNQMHLHCGGGNGSMSLNEYAGFDPIFWLHHCNVDRLYALWEYLYPEYWIGQGWKSTQTGKIVPFVTDAGSFYQDKGSEVNQSTPCHPFRIKPLDYWTSEGIRGLLSTSPVNKYYTYPAVKDPRTGIEVKVDVPYDANNLDLRKRYRDILYNEFRPDSRVVVEEHHSTFSLPTLRNLHTNLLMREENDIVHLRHFYLVGEVPEFAYPGSYRLELYLRNHPAPNAVNSISVLGRADPDICAACRDRRAAGSHVRGHMPLDPRLILYLIEGIPLTLSAQITDLVHLTALIYGSFGARLVEPDGTLLANLEFGAPLSIEEKLDASKTPRLTLHSHVIQSPLKDVESHAPLSFEEYSYHGTFGTDGDWKALK